MIYSVNLKDLTDKINPHAFAQYLANTGWTIFPTRKEYMKIFQYKTADDDFSQVIVPFDKTFNDYRRVLYDSIVTVAEVEKQTAEQLMLSLLNPNADILKIRLQNTKMEMGNITIDDGIRLYENAKKLLVAAAQDVINPKLFHRGRVDDIAAKFVDNCRFGQTEVGSYVVPIVCPFGQFDEDRSFRPLNIFSDEEECASSFTRLVVNKLLSGIATIKSCIDSGDHAGLLAQPEKSAISVNFYEALAGLNPNSQGSDLEFFTQWAPSVKLNRSAVSRIQISGDYFAPIANAVRKLKETTRKSARILGRITKLESSPDAETRTTGKIAVRYLSEDDTVKTVSVNLAKEDYHNAIKAHSDGSYVEITGEFGKADRQNVLTCDSFSVIE